MESDETLAGICPVRASPEMDNLMIDDSGPSVTRISHGKGTNMILSPQTRDLARRLIAYEGAAGKTSEPLEFAAFRVCETLRRPVCALAGIAGFRSLLSRALALARAEVPSLSAVRVAPDGSLQGLDELGRQIDKDQARVGGVILIAQLLGLLLFFIGEAMTLRLVTSEVLPTYRSIPKNGEPVGFEAILNEVDQLNGVSARLEGMAEQHSPDTQALMTLAGSIRSTATVLAVLVAVRSPKPN
jgi:hypothetical protein